MEIAVSERVIEDIFAIDKSIIAEIISLNYSDLNLLARQKILNCGIIDCCVQAISATWDLIKNTSFGVL